MGEYQAEEVNNLMPVVEGANGLERADGFSISTAMAVSDEELTDAYEQAKPATPTLAKFLGNMIGPESLPANIQQYSTDFKKSMQENPEQTKLVKSLLIPEWEAIQSVKSAVVSYANKEPMPDNPFQLKDRNLTDIPIVKQTLTSPEYTKSFINALKIGANLHFNDPTSMFFYLPKATKTRMVNNFDKLSPTTIASLSETAVDMLALGAVQGSMGLMERWSGSIKYTPTTVKSPILNLEGKGYTPAEVKSINRVQKVIDNVIKDGSTNPFSDMVKMRGTNLSGREINLWKGAHYSEGNIQYGAGLPIPQEPIKPIKGKEVIPAVSKLSPKEGGVAQPGADLKGETGKERGFVSSVKDEMPGLKVAGQYIPRSTDELAIKARTLIKEDLKTAQEMAAKGTDDASIATGAELLKYYMDQAESSSGLAKDVIYEKATELGNSMAERLTELGRSVQAASILSRLTPEGQLKFAARTIQKYNEKMVEAGKLDKIIPNLTPAQSKDIIDRMLAIRNMPEGEAKAIAFQDLQNTISDLVPTPVMDKIVAVWKAGLLTGLRTTGLNFLSNAAHAGTLMLSDFPSALVDMAVSIKTGKRAVVVNVQGYGAGFKEGVEKGKRFLATGYDERNVLSKLDYKRVNMGTSKFAKAIQKYEEWVFRALGTEDQPFYYGAKLRSLYGQAKVEALNKGLKGAERDTFIKNLVENPTDDMVLLAVEDAKIAVYQNDTALGKLAKGVQNLGEGAGNFILPFGKTPSAVATQIINYTPVAAIKTAWQNWGKNFNQRDFSEGMGKALGTGVAALGFGAWLYKSGLMTLDRPTTEAEQKLWEMEGKSANSIKIGGAWRTIQIGGPIGNVLLIGGHFAKAYGDTGSVTGAFAQGSFGAMKTFTEQTFLKGVSSFLDAYNDPKRNASSFVNSWVGSFIPTISKDIATGTDKVARRVSNLKEAIMERVPVLRYMLEPKVETFGQDVARTNNFLETMVDPTRPSKIKSDPVVGEIRRLVDAGQTVNTGQLGKRLGYESLTPKQNTELWHKAGQDAYGKVSDLIQSYADSESLTDERKAEKINKIIADANDRAKLEVILEATAGLEGDALTEKLTKMRDENLLNETLFKKYMRLR